jgi:hypothetical protein
VRASMTDDSGIFNARHDAAGLPKTRNRGIGERPGSYPVMVGYRSIMDDKMTIIFHSMVYAVILLVSGVYSLTAKADVGPPYPSNNASVFVPFVNATQLSDPSKYVSPQIRVGFDSANATDAWPVFNVTMDTGSVGIIAGSSYFNPPATCAGFRTPAEIGSEFYRSRKRNADEQRYYIQRRLVQNHCELVQRRYPGCEFDGTRHGCNQGFLRTGCQSLQPKHHRQYCR